jgi:hypothetical protein
MMRRLGDLWAGSNAAEKAFVELLLVHLANGRPVTHDTWRDAEKLWRKSVKDMIDLKRPYPENAAMYLLTAVTTAGTDMEGVMQRFYAPLPP